jgi:hypothetical protein
MRSFLSGCRQNKELYRKGSQRRKSPDQRSRWVRYHQPVHGSRHSKSLNFYSFILTYKCFSYQFCFEPNTFRQIVVTDLELRKSQKCFPNYGQ